MAMSNFSLDDLLAVQFTRMTFKKGDLLVINTPAPITHAQAASIESRMATKLPEGVSVLVLSGEARAAVIHGDG